MEFVLLLKSSHKAFSGYDHEKQSSKIILAINECGKL